MGLSTKNIFHYTNKAALFGILSDGFRFGNVNENLPIIDPESDDPLLAIPQIIRHAFKWRAICFCDIPLDHVADHRNQYGDYSIGLSKDWAIFKRITPVRYVHYYTPYNMKLFDQATNLLRHSRQYGGLIPFIVHVKKTYGQITDDFDIETAFRELPEPIHHILAELESNLIETWKMLYMSGGYLRSYKDDWKDRTEPHDTKERVFYDEKEWRAVSFEQQPANLTFKWNDISHFIVPKFSEIDPLVEHIVSLKATLEINDLHTVKQIIHTYEDDLHDA